MLHTLRSIETEVLVAQEASSFIKRRPKAKNTVLGLYGISLFGLERGRLMRASYLPIRFVDDLLDGDATGSDDPLLYAQELRKHIETNVWTNTPVERQLQYALDTLEAKAKPDDKPRADFCNAIDAIIFDRVRASERRVLSEQEIEKYYRNAFDPVMNITFLAIDSKLRIKDIPSLSYGQGRIYSARDFKVDWERGIINIPDEVISSAGLSSFSQFEDVGRSPVLKEWFQQSLIMTKPDLLEAQLILKNSREKQTQVVINSLISPMLKFIDASHE